MNENFINQLVALIGNNNVLISSHDTQPYLTENRGLYHGQTLAVVRPNTTQQVSKIVKLCVEHSVQITPQGGNTGLVGGQIPIHQNSIILSLSSLNAIRQVDATNGTISVDAGVTLQTVQEAASSAHCLFPLSLASQGTCQIGGTISSNAGGTAVLRYGNMRQLVLGLEVVLPDGRIWNGMRKLHKDNAGYDLKQLFIGSEGTLGIVTGAVLKLYPKIRSRETAFMGLNSPERAFEVYQLVKQQSGETLTAFELMPRFGLEMVIKHMQGVDPFVSPHPFYALIELSTASKHSKLKTILEECLEQALVNTLIQDATIAQNDTQSKNLWSLRENMSWAQKYEGGSIKHDVSVPVSSVPAFIEEASQLCTQIVSGIRICAFGHMGDGNIHFNISQPIGMDKALFLSHWQAFNRVVHDVVVSMEGSIAAEHGIGQLKLKELAHYKDDISLDLMRRMKTMLDPCGLMNKGKVVL